MILLTGGTGYIASHTAVALLAAGERVVLLDNLSNSTADVVGRLERLTGQPIPFVQADVRDTAAVRQVLEQHACESVIHFAGLKSVGESVAQPIAYYDHNVAGAVSLLKAMDATGVRKLVFSSSASVYGEPVRLPMDERHPTGPLNPYARSKLHIEEILADVCRGDARWHAMCLRYFNPAGAHPSGEIGENPSGVPNNLMPYIARVARGQLPALQVFGDDYDTVDGTGVRDYIHVDDLAGGHVSALRHVRNAAGWDVVNLGTGAGHSVLEMVAAFERACGRRIPYQVVPRRPGDAAACFADASKAARLLGWRATRGIDEICRSGWQWQCRLQPAA